MAKRKFLDYAGLQAYDENIKAYVDGAIDAIPSDVFVVNITQNEDEKLSSDKTCDEVGEAINSGKIIVCNAMGNSSTECNGIIANGEFEGYNFIFSSNTIDSGSGLHVIQRIVLMLTKDNEIIINDYDYFSFGRNNTNELSTTDKTIVGAINELDSTKAEANHNHDDVYETKTDAQAKLDEAKSYTDEKVSESQVIKPLPVYDEVYTESIDKLTVTVNIEELEQNILYQALTDSHKIVLVKYVFICTDGTVKNIITNNSFNQVYISKSTTGNYISLVFKNDTYKVNYGDKSTSSVVTVEHLYNINYLNVSNSAEYTPTSDYNPATKKYVDDNISSHTHDDRYYTIEQIDSYEFITVDDIDEICGANIQMASEVMF